MRKEQFVEGEYYHIYTRGVDKRVIFSDDHERTRFIHSLYLLNNFLDIPPRFDVVKLEPQELLTSVEPYVEIVAGCLMSNHYHLMLTPKRKDGVSKFLHKIGTSYTKYFNKKHERTGSLFESTFKAKFVDRQEYAVYLTQYIHLNPIELYQAKLGTDEGLKEVEKYQWSTLPDYLGKKSNFSVTVSLDFMKSVLDTDFNEYKKILNDIYHDLYQAKLGTR